MFTFIFGVNWLWHCGVTASFGVFFHEIKRNGKTNFMEFMKIECQRMTYLCGLTLLWAFWMCIARLSFRVYSLSQWKHLYLSLVHAASWSFLSLSSLNSLSHNLKIVKFWRHEFHFKVPEQGQTETPGQKHFMGPHHKTTDICRNV